MGLLKKIQVKNSLVFKAEKLFMIFYLFTFCNCWLTYAWLHFEKKFLTWSRSLIKHNFKKCSFKLSFIKSIASVNYGTANTRIIYLEFFSWALMASWPQNSFFVVRKNAPTRPVQKLVRTSISSSAHCSLFNKRAAAGQPRIWIRQV